MLRDDPHGPAVLGHPRSMPPMPPPALERSAPPRTRPRGSAGAAAPLPAPGTARPAPPGTALGAPRERPRWLRVPPHPAPRARREGPSPAPGLAPAVRRGAAAPAQSALRTRGGRRSRGTVRVSPHTDTRKLVPRVSRVPPRHPPACGSGPRGSRRNFCAPRSRRDGAARGVERGVSLRGAPRLRGRGAPGPPFPRALLQDAELHPFN